MRRLATFAWQSRVLLVVDETLAVYDDGTAWLVVRSPRGMPGMIGTFVVKPARANLAALVSVGPEPIVVDPAHPTVDTAAAPALAMAERVAASARRRPRAVATFSAGPLAPAAGGRLAMALLVDGKGRDTIEFELDPEHCRILLRGGGREVGSFAMPELGSGFVTQDGEGLGGLRRRARVRPGDFAATAFDVPAPGGAEVVSIDVAGWLSAALPDDPMPQRFAVRTAESPIPLAGAPPG